MEFTYLDEVQQSRDMLQEFRGYNHNLRISDNEFYDEQNMSCRCYPVLAPREPRGYAKYFNSSVTNLLGCIYKDTFYYVSVESGRLKLHKFNNGTQTYTDYDLCAASDSTSKRNLVSMGAYIVIFPDKYRFNTQTNQSEQLWKEQTATTATITGCNVEGETYSYYASTSAPTSRSNKTYWLDISEKPYVMKQWSESASMWFQVSTTYLRINISGIENNFKVGDAVKITTDQTELSDLNGKTSIIQKVGTGYIVVIGTTTGGSPSKAQEIVQNIEKGLQFIANIAEWFLGVIGFETGSSNNTSTNLQTAREVTLSSGKSITIAREVPDLDYVVESDNRLWGAHYGTYGGKSYNEICCCKLGDPTNWNSFAGTSMDSYYASLGSDGDFTGSAVFGGTILFFKENCIHKVYGNYPANFQIVTTKCRGVQKGSSESVKVVNELLYYKSNEDICAYDGSLPVSVSDVFGTDSYNNATAGVCNGKYYISMLGEDNNYHYFCYDSKYGLWHKEDNTHATDFFNDEKGLCFYNGTRIMRSRYISDDIGSKSDVEWSCETGVIGFDSPDNKYISRFNIRMQLEPDAVCSMFIEYDSSGVWESKGAMKGRRLRTFTLPIIPKRCDHFRLKFSGRGDCKIFSITKITEGGSDIR